MTQKAGRLAYKWECELDEPTFVKTVSSPVKLVFPRSELLCKIEDASLSN